MLEKLSVSTMEAGGSVFVGDTGTLQNDGDIFVYGTVDARGGTYGGDPAKIGRTETEDGETDGVVRGAPYALPGMYALVLNANPDPSVFQSTGTLHFTPAAGGTSVAPLGAPREAIGYSGITPARDVDGYTVGEERMIGNTD